MDSFLLCPHVTFPRCMCTKRESKFSDAPSYKATLRPHFIFITSLQALSSNTVHWVLSCRHIKFRGCNPVHSSPSLPYPNSHSFHTQNTVISSQQTLKSEVTPASPLKFKVKVSFKYYLNQTWLRFEI